MKKYLVLLGLLVFSFTLIAAQEEDMLDWDIDSIFDEPPPETAAEEDTGDNVSPVLGDVKRRGLIVDASYEFQGIIAPGWDTAPWFFDGKEVYSHGLGVKLGASLSLDAQISEAFRTRTVVTFSIPSLKFELGDFFFDYNFFDKVFVRAGKYEHSWGISPNYGFTNLLSRIPKEGPSGPSYIFKTDVPIGVGGIQALFMTRVRMIEGSIPEHRKDFAFGGKYNLAFRRADLDIGFLYQDEMATRGFISAKTTLWDVEIYNEWLVAVNTHTDNEASFAVNVGFAKKFFGEKFTLNGEFFYNGEESALFYRPETNLLEEEILPFIENINMAFNLLYKFGGKVNPRIFAKVLYAPMQTSAQVIPGFIIAPLSNIEIYLAVPMALGKKSGYYYQNSVDHTNTNRPFSIMLYVTLKDSVQAGYYY